MKGEYYVALHIDADPCTDDVCDLLADDLASLGFDSFELTDTGIIAYCPASVYDLNAVKAALDDFILPAKFTFREERVERHNWNRLWEQEGFKPIQIGDECIVHASRHTDVPKVKYDIKIDPRMSFGTGSHATTRMILQILLKMELAGKSVIDMGAGTGILSILCAMRGAAPVVGIEIDEGAYENACENGEMNGVAVDFRHGDAALLKDLSPADLFIANINRNIILNDFDAYRAAMKRGGECIFSGFLQEDLPIIIERCHNAGLDVIEVTSSADGWQAVRFADVMV